MTYNNDPSAAAVLQRPGNVISSDQLLHYVAAGTPYKLRNHIIYKNIF